QETGAPKPLLADQEKTGFEADPPGQDRHGDPLPPGAIARLGSARLRLGGLVQGLAFSHDGKLLAGLGGGLLCVWSAGTGKELARDARHKSHGVTLAFSADDKTLVFVGDSALIFHDLSKISEKATVPVALEEKHPAIPHPGNEPTLLTF